MAAATAIGNDIIRPTMAADNPRSNVSGPMDTRSVDACDVANRITARADKKPAMVQTAVDTILGLTPVRRARSALVTEAADRLSEPGVAEQPPQSERDERDGDDRQKLGAGDGDVVHVERTEADALDGPLPGDRARKRGLQRAGAVVGERLRDRLGQLGHADGGDQHDDPRRLEQSPDHGQLDDGARGGPDEHRGDQPEPVGPVWIPTMIASSAVAGTPRSPTAKLMTRLER